MASTILYDVGSIKNKLISTFLNNKDICEVLLNKTDYTDEEVDALIYNQVYPYLYADDTQTEELVYICVEVDPVTISPTIKGSYLTIWVYAHKGVMKYSKKGYSGTRVDILSDMIERSIRDSYSYGIGKLKFERAPHFFPSRLFYGREMKFIIPDFKVKER